ncbi:hypothetical protein [Microbacterium sp. CIAB417]|uniref:hypothetical protein n=1 Tax=Microbacterium sp. CIAB417 TaxID=2860287 RepID=UPI001FAD1DE0|nr:hypothetical protein [Microbacterium sp. CIAB417]
MTDPAWVALLERFERDLETIAAAGDEASGEVLAPWEPPAAPLPRELEGRVRRLLDRQRAQRARTRAVLRDLRGQRDALGRIPAARGGSAYLDTQA